MRHWSSLHLSPKSQISQDSSTGCMDRASIAATKMYVPSDNLTLSLLASLIAEFCFRYSAANIDDVIAIVG